MKDKLELLLHIDAPTRKEVLKWCKDYETEIAYVKRQYKMLYEIKRGVSEEKMVNQTVTNVGYAVRRSDVCHVFYNGRFKVLTQPARIAKETGIHVGIYDKNFKSEYLIEDLLCTLKDVKEKTVPTDPNA